MTTAHGPGEAEMYERRAGRGIVLDPDHRVLMVRGHDPADRGRGGFWWTPGGGLDEHETIESGTRRELWEELGLTVEELGAPVLFRVGEFPFGGRWIRQREQYFVIEVDTPFTPEPQHFEPLEEAAIAAFEWLSVRQLRALDEPSFPWCLADLIEFFGERGRPEPPWTERQLRGD